MNYTFEKLARHKLNALILVWIIICMCMISFRIYTLYRKGSQKKICNFRLIVLQMQLEEHRKICIFRGL